MTYRCTSRRLGANLLRPAARSLLTVALLAGAAQGQNTNEQSQWEVIDGSKTPRLIDDRDAYASFCIAMAGQREGEQIRRGDFLHETAISTDGAKIVFSACDRYYTTFIELKRQMASTMASAPRPYSPETIATFDKLVAANQTAAEKEQKSMEEGLSRSDFWRMNRYVQYRIKSGMIIGRKK
jgi:hypothetical protein